MVVMSCVAIIKPGPAIAGPDSPVDKSAIIKALKTAEAAFGCQPNCTHKILGTYAVTLTSGPLLLVATASNDSEFGGCHACGVIISFFAYTKKAGKWHGKWRRIPAMTRGGWGEFDAGQISLERLSPRSAGLFVTHEYSGTVNVITRLEVFLLAHGALKNVLSVCTAASNKRAYEKTDKDYFEWSATWQLHPAKGRPANILFKIIDLTTGNNTRTRFVFDGEKYAPATPAPRTTNPDYACAGEQNQ